MEGVVILGIAGVDCMLFKILNTSGFQIRKDAFVDIIRNALKRIIHLKRVLDVDLPLFFTILSRVE